MKMEKYEREVVLRENRAYEYRVRAESEEEAKKKAVSQHAKEVEVKEAFPFDD